MGMNNEIDFKKLQKDTKFKKHFRMIRKLEKEKLKIFLYRAETMLELEEIKDRKFDNIHTASLYNTYLESFLDTDKMLAEVTEMQVEMYGKIEKKSLELN